MLIVNGKVIVEERDLAETFNDHYINIVEKSSGQKPCNFVSDTHSLEDDVVINEIVQHYSNHPSILKIREHFDNSQTVEQFQFNSVTTSEIYKLHKNIDEKRLQERIKFLLNWLKYLLRYFFNHWRMLLITIFLKEFFLTMQKLHLFPLMINNPMIKINSQMLDQLVF